MQLIDGTKGIACTELQGQDIKAISSPLAMKVLKLLASHPGGLHAFVIAKRLGEHEQKIYYHTRRLRKAGILEIHHTEGSGATAKVLTLKTPSFAIRLQEMEPLARIATYLPEQLAYLAPFIEGGRMHAKIIVGSPDPHGPEHARSRDANYAIDLGIFLGTFLTTRALPIVLLDTELRDWNQNLIIIGGPVVNKAAEKINERSPARYDKEAKAFIIADLTGEPYSGTQSGGRGLAPSGKASAAAHERRASGEQVGNAFPQEDIGVIVKMPNPFAKGKWILYITGRRHTGTKAAILAFLTRFEEVCKNNVNVVEGLDMDSDGVIDEAKIL